MPEPNIETRGVSERAQEILSDQDGLTFILKELKRIFDNPPDDGVRLRAAVLVVMFVDWGIGQRDEIWQRLANLVKQDQSAVDRINSELSSLAQVMRARGIFIDLPAWILEGFRKEYVRADRGLWRGLRSIAHATEFLRRAAGDTETDEPATDVLIRLGAKVRLALRPQSRN